jgi:hypothetical protein
MEHLMDRLGSDANSVNGLAKKIEGRILQDRGLQHSFLLSIFFQNSFALA